VVIAVSVDIRTNVWLLVMVLNARGDGVSLDGLVFRIGHGQRAGEMKKKRMGMKVAVDLVLYMRTEGRNDLFFSFLTGVDDPARARHLNIRGPNSSGR